MPAQQLFIEPIPDQTRDLRSSLLRMDQLAGLGLPQLDGLVLSAASCGQEAFLPGAPGDGLDASLVVIENVPGLLAAQVPEADEIVVAA